MGQPQSTPKNSCGNPLLNLPVTEFTPCAVLLKKMGYRVVVWAWEDAVLPLSDPSIQQFRVNGHWAVYPYDDGERLRLIQALSRATVPDVREMMTAMASQGLQVVIMTHQKSRKNGNCVSDEEKNCSGYIFEGAQLLERVVRESLGDCMAKLVHVGETNNPKKTLKQIQKMYDLKDHEILVIHPDPEVIRFTRKEHMGGILVDDHRWGFQWQ